MRDPRHLGVLPRQRRRAGARRRASSRRRRKSASRARSTTPASRTHAIALLPARAPACALADVDRVAFYDKPFLKFERLLETYLAFAPRGFASFRQALPVWVKDKLFQKQHPVERARTSIDAGSDWDEQAALLRAPPEPRGERVLPLAVRARGGADAWTASASGPPPRSPLGNGRDLEGDARDPLPALARPAVLRVHLLHRLQGELRRVQGDGPRALRRAALRAADQRASDRHQGRRQLPAQPRLLRLLHRPHDDQRAGSTSCSAARRASPRSA